MKTLTQADLLPYAKKRVEATLSTVSGEIVRLGKIVKYKNQLVFRTEEIESSWFDHEIIKIIEV